MIHRFYCWGPNASVDSKISQIDLCHIFDVIFIIWHQMTIDVKWRRCQIFLYTFWNPFFWHMRQNEKIIQGKSENWGNQVFYRLEWQGDLMNITSDRMSPKIVQCHNLYYWHHFSLLKWTIWSNILTFQTNICIQMKNGLFIGFGFSRFIF